MPVTWRRTVPVITGLVTAICYLLAWGFPEWPDWLRRGLHLLGLMSGFWFGIFLAIDILVRTGRLDPDTWTSK